MNVKFLNPFVEAACEVLRMETDLAMERGAILLEKEAYRTDDVTVILSLVGAVEGNVFYSMSVQTALALAGRILGETFLEFNVLAQSGIAEIGNVITGRASTKLAKAGYKTTLSPPTLLHGKGAQISTLDFPRLVVTLRGECGPITIHLALREGALRKVSVADLPVVDWLSFHDL